MIETYPCGCEKDVQSFGTQIRFCAAHRWMAEKPLHPRVSFEDGGPEPQSPDELERRRRLWEMRQRVL